MASFIPTLPTSYLPQSIQKRLLRAALSSLGIFDTASLDLDNLDLEFGLRSTLNLRNLGLDRLKELLTLPPEFNVETARVNNVRVVLPTDIHRSGIEVEIDGVKAHGILQTKATKAANEREEREKQRRDADANKDIDLLERLPGLVDLEQSFHDGQSVQERKRMVKTTFWKGMDDSVYSDDSDPLPSRTRTPPRPQSAPKPSQKGPEPSDDSDDDESDILEEGTGMAIGLPEFLTNFIKGIGDRVNITIKDIRLSLETDTASTDGNTVLDLQIKCVDVEGIAVLASLPKITDDNDLQREGKRKISVNQLRAYIIANEELFHTPDPIVSPPPEEMSGSTETVKSNHGEEGAAPPNMDESVSTVRGGAKTPEKKQRSAIEVSDSPIDFSAPFAGLPSLDDLPPIDDLPKLDSRPMSPGLPPFEGPSQEDFDREMEKLLSEDDRFADFEDDGAVYREREYKDEDGRTYKTSELRPSTIRGTVELPLVFSPNPEETDKKPEPPTPGPSQPAVPKEETAPSPSAELKEEAAPALPPPQTETHPESDSDDDLPPHFGVDDSDDEQDPMASSMFFSHMSEDESSNKEMSKADQDQLSQSMFFSHEEAESLYLSATSGASASHARAPHFGAEIEDDKLSETEVEARLDRLIGLTHADSKDDAGREKTPEPLQRRLRKYIFGIDQITVFVPAISDKRAKKAPAPEAQSFQPSSPESHYGNIPGSFSYHIDSPPPRPAARVPPPPKPQPETAEKEAKDNKIEIIVSNVLFSLDIATSKLIFDLLNSLSFTKAPAKKSSGRNSPPPPSDSKLDILIKLVTCSLVQNLPGIVEGETIYDDNEPETEPSILLSTQVSDIRIESQTIENTLAQFTKICVSKVMVLDPHGDPLMAFGNMSPKNARKKPHLKNDIEVSITSSSQSTDIGLETKRLLVMLRLDRIEELIFALGGFDSVVNLASSVTGTVGTVKPTTPVKGVRWSDETVETVEPEPSTPLNFDAWIGGIKVSVISKDETARISLKTSVVTVSKTDGIKINLDNISAFGPGLEQEGTYATINNTTVEFDSAPNDEEDFPRLLRLLTPSKDKFAKDDDILVETMLKQRRQGAVARITSNELKLCVGNRDELAKLLMVAQEIMRIVTVTNFVAQDERPGILTFLLLQNVDACLDMGDKIGSLEIDAKDLEVAHVPAPLLLATAVRTIDIKRNVNEDLMGEGIPRSTMPISERDRPVIMLRLIGDEPEPVIKIKLWNLRMEYHVETIMDATGQPSTASKEELAQALVESVASLAENLGARRVDQGPKEGGDSDTPETKIPALNIAIRDSVVALNPLGLPSRGLIVLTEAQVNTATPASDILNVNVAIKKASFMLIDDRSRLQSLRPQTSTVGFSRPNDHVSRFLEMGYVNMITISSASAELRLADAPGGEGKFIDVTLKDDLLLLETCADSTQTMIELFNALKPPVAESTEIKYMTEIMPLDVFASISEDELVHPSLKKKQKQKMQASTQSIFGDESDTHTVQDAIEEDAPVNLSFVESYYGQLDGRQGPDSDILDEDLDFIARPSSSSGASLLSSYTEEIQVHNNDPLDLEDSFFKRPGKPVPTIKTPANIPVQNTNNFKAKKPDPQGFYKWSSVKQKQYTAGTVDKVSPLCVRVRDVNVIWKMHDGYDWPKTRDTISRAVKSVQTRSEQQRMRRTSFGEEDENEHVGDFLFNSIYIAIPPNADPRSLSQQINHSMDDGLSETGSYASSSLDTRYSSATERGTARSRGRGGLKLTRSKKHKLQIELQGVCADFVLFPPDSGETQSSLDIRVRDFEILDNVPTSTWKKFVTYMKDNGMRQMGSDMAHILLLNVRPIPELAATEMVIKVAILPLRLHVDQDALDFLTRFFEFKDTSAPTPTVPPEEPFIQRLEVDAVKIKLDYKPKKVDYAGIRSGHTTEFMNFFILDASEMTLRRCTLLGVSGFSKIHKLLNDVWMPDIKNNQLAGVVSGLAPVRSLVNIGVGVTDLVAVPVREYKKDGRVVRAIQKGAFKFAKTTTAEVVRLGAKVAVGTQNILEGADTILGNHPKTTYDYSDFDSDSEDPSPRNQISPYADQPSSIGQGLRGAYQSLNKNFGEARDALRSIPGQAAEKGSVQGAAGVVARAGAIAVLRPMVGVTEAVGRTLHGVGNSLDREHLRKVEDKYKRH
ncbi:hypothetical protein BJ508DRAFT_326223 [Ascobolus immersus RN42]|uniref:Autophagy-related protein 2 n=1 Tax=Ascobolus immersus RN42 TaxID=1160509 RepID=A0A3N4I7R7_ASCIM|nr:hypothetical protein BJ508DRAFT_326223 [Ascobolus immersus RN42]